MSELSLRKNGVERITYTKEINKAVSSVAEAWEAFRLLPLEEKQRFASNNFFNGVGYESKINDSVSNDRKENFDYTSGPFGRSRALRGMNISTETRSLVNAFDDLTDVSMLMLENFWWKLQGSQPPDYGDDERAIKSARAVFLRCLYYPAGAEPGTIIAEPHTDHSGGTTHFYESTDGCEMLTLDKNKWKPMPINEAQGIRFGGMQTQLASAGEITALCHRVVANKTTAEVGRSAIVGFMPFVDMRQYDRQRKGRTQDQVPGFNYGLKGVELDDFFTK